MVKYRTKRTEIKPTTNHETIKDVSQSTSKPSMLADIGQNILQGFTFGTGSALAHRAISTVFDNTQNQQNKKDCKGLLESFQKCTQNNDYETCKHIFEEFTECSK